MLTLRLPCKGDCVSIWLYLFFVFVDVISLLMLTYIYVDHVFIEKESRDYDILWEIHDIVLENGLDINVSQDPKKI